MALTKQDLQQIDTLLKAQLSPIHKEIKEIKVDIKAIKNDIEKIKEFVQFDGLMNNMKLIKPRNVRTKSVAKAPLKKVSKK